jgi:hypothetical protein
VIGVRSDVTRFRPAIARERNLMKTQHHARRSHHIRSE